MRNVYTSLDHNALLYHKRFLDSFVPLLGDMYLSPSDVSQGDKFK
jgi:hypothetical protein